MFRTATNSRIGKYLTKLIDNMYPTSTAFCIEWLKLENPQFSDSDKETINRKLNKLSQIKNGKKGIQIQDLGYFCELLNVSCEELLSATAHPITNETRATNYSFAFSKDPVYWERYIQRKDSIILNADEREKTVIDYALEFKNYELIKYLIDHNYIWFVNETQDFTSLTFGAGTKIERMPHGAFKLESELVFNDSLRTNIVSLALENKDISMLEYLHARETPDLYFCCCYTGGPGRYEDCYNPDLIQHIIQSDPSVINYFTESFKINYKGKTMPCIFPYTSQLIEQMIKCNSKHTKIALKNAVNHNKRIFETLSQMITHAFNLEYSSYPSEPKICSYSYATKYFTLYTGDFFSYMYYSTSMKNHLILCANIVQVHINSNNPEINSLIEELNQIFSDITELNQEKLLIENIKD